MILKKHYWSRVWLYVDRHAYARCLARCQKDDGSWKPSLKGRL